MIGLGRIFAAFALLLAATNRVAAADREFSGLLKEVSQRYEAQVTHIPLMGFVSFCARVVTHGGVKHLHVAEFDNVPEGISLSELQSLFRKTLSADWQPFVVERDQEGKNLSVIFVHPVGKAMRMLIADYNHKELDLVHLELNGSRLAQWVKKPGSKTWNQ